MSVATERGRSGIGRNRSIVKRTICIGTDVGTDSTDAAEQTGWRAAVLGVVGPTTTGQFGGDEVIAVGDEERVSHGRTHRHSGLGERSKVRWDDAPVDRRSCC